ncbi:hypothetical protein Cni_G06642 [Canna indica]|uniref:RING-CH-type domain-containing protein n=1 Tax=Canna indica TaxID=4628 RepID=A0AAQ3JZ08_9LILI|nr:hypothetical protein Cni_G06642 [Canna indica]
MADGEQRSVADAAVVDAAVVVVVVVELDDRTVLEDAVEEEAGGGKKGAAAGGSAPAAEVGVAGAVVVDVAGSGDGAMMDDGSGFEATACRICHLSPDRGEKGSGLFHLGCGCKGELGTAHRHCAEAWFRVKGNRYCEICGANAKNITGEDDSKFMDEWYERGEMSNRNSPERCGCLRRQSFCNFLMACLVIAFILPWFFRVNMF